MAAWPFLPRGKASDPTLFQTTLVAFLIVTVLGDCGPPPILPFASPINQLYETKFETGASVKYTCKPGFKIVSSNHLTCAVNGAWIYNVFCEKKQCRNPGELINGKVEIVTDLLFGSVIKFSCSKGYLLIGSATSQCEIRGNGTDWSDSLPECLAIKCDSPPAIMNGKHSGGHRDFYTYGSVVTYKCESDFSLIGNASISCTVVNKTMGVWSPSPPTCEKITCHPPQIANGALISGFGPLYTYKDSIVIKCKKGYRLNGSSLILCDTNGEWYPSIPTCEHSGCTTLPDIPFASWEKNILTLKNLDGFEVGTELKYQCKPGYQPAPSEAQIITCQENRTWTLSKGCERVCCPTPDLENIKIISERKDFSSICTYAYGDYVYYMCEEGYYPISPDGRSLCQVDGMWNPVIPLCQPGKNAEGDCQFQSVSIKGVCLKPEIKHGKLSVEKNHYVEMEKLTLRCDSGYDIVGPQSIICLQNRTWYPEIPTCEKEVLKGCEQVQAGRKLMKCLPSHEDVKRALEVYKLSLEIKQLQEENNRWENTQKK
uniref:Zona pellucida sperm-binding protein 3 receptor n=1 Tax=Jaculus jaculus TaxID=51337 RepID=A0A8C5L7J8_JACJA